MTSANLLIVMVVGTLVGTFTGKALGGLIDILYLAMIAGLLATIIAGIVHDQIMMRVGLEPEREGMPQLEMPRLITIDRRIPLRVIGFSALASLAGSMSAV